MRMIYAGIFTTLMDAPCEQMKTACNKALMYRYKWHWWLSIVYRNRRPDTRSVAYSITIAAYKVSALPAGRTHTRTPTPSLNAN